MKVVHFTFFILFVCLKLPVISRYAVIYASDVLLSADTMKMTKSVELNSVQSPTNTPPTSTPVATAFTIDFDIPKASAPNKKFAIKDSLKKFAPPKPNNEENRGHRRSSSQNIVVEDETVSFTI